jgi:hypothetical protein
MNYTQEEITTSLLRQKQIFQQYQKTLLSFVNSDEGKYVIGEHTGARPEFPVVFINRNGIIEKTPEKDTFRATFYSRQPFTDVLLPLLTRFWTLRRNYYFQGDLRDIFYLPKYGPQLKDIELDYSILFGFGSISHLAKFLSSTFNPAAGANSPVDGRTTRGGVDEAFSTIRSGAGTAAQAANSSELSPRLTHSGTSNQFAQMDRAVFLFDTSVLTTAAKISAAVFSPYITTSVANTPSQNYNVSSSNPASNNALVAADYNIANWGSTKFATEVSLSSLATSSYNDFTLNASGIANIVTNGISKFGARLSGDIDNSAPAWISGADVFAETDMADNGSNKPKLTVTYTLTGSGFFYSLL